MKRSNICLEMAKIYSVFTYSVISDILTGTNDSILITIDPRPKVLWLHAKVK